MKIGIKSLLVGFGAVMVLASIAAQANAQFTSNTFDNASSFLTTGRNYNPPPIFIGFDYGTFTAQLTAAVAFDATHDNTGNGGGSAKLSWSWDNSDGAGSSAFVVDVNPDANTLYSNISFDLMVDPSSTLGHDPSNNPSDYGYFQVFQRDNGYGGFNQLVGQSTGSTAGVWQHISEPITGEAQAIRALEFQWYNDSFRNITGPEIMYIDNLTLTPVPEPASLALLGLAVPGLAFVARRYRKA